MDLFKAETTWFHVFVSMIENGDVAKMGPYAVTVYLVVKAYTNWSSRRNGKKPPAAETAPRRRIAPTRPKTALPPPPSG